MRRFARIIGRARSSGMVCKHAYWHRVSKRCYQVDCFCSTGSGSNSSYRIGSPRARLHLKPVRAMASRSHCSIVTHKVSHRKIELVTNSESARTHRRQRFSSRSRKHWSFWPRHRSQADRRGEMPGNAGRSLVIAGCCNAVVIGARTTAAKQQCCLHRVVAKVCH
jgi:hypothetical protein